MELVEPGYAVVDEGGLAVAWQEFAVLSTSGGATGVLGVMVMPYHSEHRWSRVGAVYASDVCQFRDTFLPKDLPISLGSLKDPPPAPPQGSCDQWRRGFGRVITGSHHRVRGLGITSIPRRASRPLQECEHKV